jgi:hypothetical protein
VGCLAALLIVGGLMLHTFASFDYLPARAFHAVHDRLRPGLPQQEAAAILLELMDTSGGNFEVLQVAPDGQKRVLVAKYQKRSERPSAAALASNVDHREPIGVWMGTFNLSGRFVILLDADGRVREVSKIDGYVK